MVRVRAGGLGIILIVSGAVLLQPSIPDLVKVAMIIVLQSVTSAVGSTTLARAAYRARSPLVRHFDELAEHGSDSRT